MRPMHGLLVLAIVAALWGAPSSASAAVNELSSPQVTPGSGSVTTVFAFRVRYDGGFPAASVRVNVASLSVPMLLESGTLDAGWWSGSALLPAGAWSTTFTATATHGPAATIPGPAVIVAGPIAPSPTASSVVTPGSGPTPRSAPADSADGPAAPPAAPAPSPAETVATGSVVASPGPSAPDPDPAPGRSADPGGSTGSAGGSGGSAGSGGSDAPAQGGSEVAPAPGAGATQGNQAPAGQGGPAPSGPGSPAPGGVPDIVHPSADAGADGGDRARTDEVVSDVLLVGLAGVASVAVVGTLLLLAGRRRAPQRAPAVVEPAGAAPTVADDTPVRRMARTGRDRASGDPILAALGVDDEMAARRAIRRSLREGAGEGQPPSRRPRQR